MLHCSPKYWTLDVSAVVGVVELPPGVARQLPDGVVGHKLVHAHPLAVHDNVLFPRHIVILPSMPISVRVPRIHTPLFPSAPNNYAPRQCALQFLDTLVGDFRVMHA